MPNRRIAMSPTRRTALGLTLAISAAMMVLASTRAQAASDDAGQILRAMSDYLAAQKTISLTFDSDIEVITPDVQKIQFTNSGTLLLHRPNEIRVTRTGGYADVEMFFDG